MQRFPVSLALLLAAAPSALAQTVDDSVRAAEPVRHAGTLHLASGVLTPSNGQSYFVTPGVIYDNTCPTPNFSSLLNGNTLLDDGRLPSTTSPAPNVGTFIAYRVTSFQIGYCTRELDPGLGGPGATVQTAFWQDYDDCTSSGVAGTPQAAFTISGLPASSAVGTLSCWTVTIDLTGGNEFTLLADANGVYDGMQTLDGFGYALSMPNQTGTTTATVGGFLIAGNLTAPGDCPAGDATYYKNPAAPNGTGLDNNNLFYREGVNPGQTINACLFFGNPPAPHGGFYMRITGDLDDCNSNAIPDALDISSGTSADCNANGVPDECDIASGASGDCDGNAVPDECDIAAGTSPDCNANGVPDSCDIAAGTSSDFNFNGVPDDCEGAGSTAYCFGDGSGTACPCGNTGASGQGCANSTGQGVHMFKINSTSVALDDMELYGVNAPPNEIGLFFLGIGQVSLPFGDGLRCIGQPVQRFAAQTSGAAGVLRQQNAVAQSMGQITAGSTWEFQVWYRDNAGPCATGVNMSNGLSVTFTP